MSAVAVAADAMTPVTLVDTDLAERRVVMTSIDNGRIGYFDEDRSLQRDRLDGVVQLRRDSAVMAPGESWLELVDGQRVVGRFGGVAADGGALLWETEGLGVLRITLDELRAVTWSGAPMEDAIEGDDAVRLTNGDVMSGFASAIGQDGLTLDIDGATPLLLPWDRVAALSLANPSMTDEAGHDLVRLTDGSALLATDIRVADDELRFRSPLVADPEARYEVEMTRVVRIERRRAGYRVVNLADLPRRVVTEARVLGLPYPLRVEQTLMRLHAPAEVEFELPEGAQRFAAWAELDVSPTEPAALAGFDLLIETGVESPLRFHIDADDRSHRVNAPVSSGLLRLRLDPGPTGPILDRLRLREPMVLFRTEPDSRRTRAPLP